jgi:outer membrane protein assembly factor BamB
VVRQFKLPDGVKCIVSDGEWLYAGCDDGNVYDLTGKVPRVAYRIAESVDIYWLDIHDGVLGVSDAQGGVTIINHEDEGQWERKSSGPGGWMVRCDEIGVYHGHSGGVTMYDWEDGTQLWHQGARGSVLFGWQEEGMVYAGTGYGTIECITKRGELARSLKCDGGIFSCAAAPGGKYVFGGDSSSTVYCFNEAGERLWKLGTGCGSAFSMQYHNERLYLVTTDGSLACVDVGEAAIKAAEAGQVAAPKTIATPKPVAIAKPDEVETTVDVNDGVVVEVVKDGAQLRVRVVSSGYKRDWFVQFPKDLRHEGAKYVVDEVREAARGDFYRAHGAIRRLVT